MAACPKHRTSRMSQRKRRTHYKAAPVPLMQCVQCFEPKQPHRVCPSCGFYDRNKKVIDIKIGKK